MRLISLLLQALTASSALPRSVSNAVHRHMTPSDRDLLTTLLKMCFPAAQQSCIQLVGVVSDVSHQLDTASKTTKVWSTLWKRQSTASAAILQQESAIKCSSSLSFWHWQL